MDCVAAGASTTETLWIALAGGAIGVLLTGIAWCLVKAAGVPGDIRRHDFEARVVNEDLELWAIDEYRNLRRELRIIENSPPKGQPDWIYSGAYGNARSATKSAALHRWRVRLHAAERSIVEIESMENRSHRLLRRRRSPEGLALRAAARVEPIIDEFRQPITRHGQDHVKVFDPTTVQLDDVIRGIRESPLEPAVSTTVEYVSDGAGGRIRHVHNEAPPATDDLPGLSGPIGDSERPGEE
jgi:hypothetical protein